MIIHFAKIIRWPNLLIIALTQYLVAVLLIPSNTYESVWRDTPFMILILSTVLIAAGGYLINDYYDIKIDYINKPERVVAGRFITRRQILFAHTLLTFLGILGGTYVSMKIGILNVLAAGLLWLYSNQLKRMPLWGNFAIASLTAVAVYLVYFYYKESFFLILSYTAFAFFMSLIREILKDLEDIKGDKAFGLRTLPIAFGVRRSKNTIYLITVLFIVSVGYLLFKEPKFYMVLGGLSLALIVLSIGLHKADKPIDFKRLSRWSKIIMLLGLITMFGFA